MRFPTIWYVRPAKAQISQRSRTTDQSVCLSLVYSMIFKLLNEHHLEFISLKGGCKGSSDSILMKGQVVGKHMSRFIKDVDLYVY